MPGGQRDPTWLVDTVRAAARAVQALRDGVAAGTAGLAVTAATDPVPGVRLVAFKQLEMAEPAKADQIAGQLLSEPEPELRLLAARRVGTDALHVIRALVSPQLEDDLVVDAIRSLPPLEGAGCEPFLLSRLGALSNAGHLAAIEVLGQVGTVDTIAPLQAFSPAFGAVKRAVDTAISEIRSRMPAVEGGWVSLVEGGGEVSVVEGEDAGAEEGELARSAARRRMPEG